MSGRPVRVAFLFFAGSMLLQTAWILALPPFRGIDEFDHAYRAAAVAEGQWKPDYLAARDGRGWYLTVPRSLAEAATPVCESYDYTGPENCGPVEPVGDAHVTIASAAAKYSPQFYWLVGVPSLLFDGGEEKLLAMRGAGALMCSLLVALAAWILASWSSTRWPAIALAVTMTPMVVYSSSLGAPNGIEMLAGLVIWSALVGLVRTPDVVRGRAFIYASTPAVVVLIISRALGPVWLFLIGLTMVLFVGVRQSRSLFARYKTPLLFASVFTLFATLCAGWWDLATRVGTEPEGPGGFGHGALSHHLRSALLWILQSVAAFPTRGEQAPTIVYACSLTVIGSLLILALRHSPRRISYGVAFTSVFAIMISSFFNLVTYDAWGQIWQGRYALAYTIGIPVLAAYGLDQRGFKAKNEMFMVTLGGALICVAQAVSVTHVLLTENRQSPLAGTSAWLAPPTWLVILFIVSAILLWTAAVSGSDNAGAKSTEEGIAQPERTSP